MALQSMREKMTGPIVWGVVGLLCLVFAVWGIGASPLFGGSDPTLAKVGGVKITQSQFQQAYNRSYRQMLQMMGKNFDPSKIDQQRFRKGVLDNMIEQTMLQQYAVKRGYVTTNAAIYGYVSQLPSFQDNGKFSSSLYHSVLASNGTDPQQFESRVREALRIQQLRNGILGTAFLVPKRALATWNLMHETRDAQEVLFATKTFLPQVTVSDQQLKQYYEKHKSDFIAPKRVKLQYIELAQNKLTPAAKPDTAVLKTIYETQKERRFKVPGQRKASHILIRFNGDPAAAKNTAEKIKAKLVAGGNFASLAKKYSDDPGSKDKGGSLGWLSQGMTAPTFDSTLFGLAKAGDVSAPVKTKFGWDIIKLDAVRPGHVKAFSDPDVQTKLLKTYRSHAAAKAFGDKSTKLANLAFENPSSLEPAAKALGLKVQTTGWITQQGGAGIAAHQSVVDAAFSQVVFDDAQNSKPITIAAADQVVIRKLKSQPERQLGFDKVKQKIHDKLVQDAARQKARAAAQGVVKAVKGGKSLKAAAQVKDEKIKTLKTVTRDGSQDKQLIAAIFALPEKHGDASAGVGMTELANGDYAVVALKGIQHPQPKAGSDDLTKAARQYSQTLAGSELDAYRETMKSAVGIKREKSPSDTDQQGGGA